jgi:hypothetical protein
VILARPTLSRLMPQFDCVDAPSVDDDCPPGEANDLAWAS